MGYKLFLLFLFKVSVLFARAQGDPLTIIANNKGAPSDMNLAVVKSVFKGEKQRWNDGTKVTIALMKTSTSVGSSTCKKIFNMSGDELGAYFLRLEFAGKSPYPKTFDTVEDLEAFVARTPGAIGIISGQNNNPAIKEITVEGKKIL